MKASHCAESFLLGALAGIGVGYWIATDPTRRRKVNRFVGKVEDKIDEIKDRVVNACGCGCQDGLTEDEYLELEAIVAAEEAIEAEEAKASRAKSKE